MSWQCRILNSRSSIVSRSASQLRVVGNAEIERRGKAEDIGQSHHAIAHADRKRGLVAEREGQFQFDHRVAERVPFVQQANCRSAAGFCRVSGSSARAVHRHERPERSIESPEGSSRAYSGGNSSRRRQSGSRCTSSPPISYRRTGASERRHAVGMVCSAIR